MIKFLKYLLLVFLGFSFILGCLITGYWYGYITHNKAVHTTCTTKFFMKFKGDPLMYGCMALPKQRKIRVPNHLEKDFDKI